MRRWIARALTLVMVAGVVETAAVADPAWACGCGAYIPSSGTASVAREQAVVRFDGTTEDVVMRFSVHSDAADAAWVMPVPGPAKVTLGDKALFSALDEFTAPKVVTRHHFFPHFDGFAGGAAAPGASAGAPPTVRVLSDQRVGDFEVADLAATDPEALHTWLAAHGYTLKPGTADRLNAYVKEGWQYVAVRLASGTSQALDGALDPIRISFAASQAVYPMRLSAGATSAQYVEVAVLAPHRMDVVREPDPEYGSHVGFGDWVDRASAPPALADLAGGRMFLTVFDDTYYQPSKITQDYGFDQAQSDTVEHQTIDGPDELLTWFGIPAFLWVFVIVPVTIALAMAIAMRVMLRRKRAQRTGRPTTVQ